MTSYGFIRWDNAILVVDLAHVNKAEATSYLSGAAPAPDRYAKATISFGATEEPYYQDFYVGPIGDNMTYTSYDWVTTTGAAKIRNYDADSSRQYELWFNLSMEVEDIIQDLLNAVCQMLPASNIRAIAKMCHIDAC